MATPVHSLQLRSLAYLPTLDRRQCCDLKLETDSGERWWLCRLPKKRSDHRVTIEKYNNQTETWETKRVFTDRGAR